MVTFSGPSCQRYTGRTHQAWRQVFGQSLVKLCDELIYMLKALVGFSNRDMSAQTSFDRAAQRPKNRFHQVIPNHSDRRKCRRAWVSECALPWRAVGCEMLILNKWPKLVEESRISRPIRSRLCARTPVRNNRLSPSRFMIFL